LKNPDAANKNAFDFLRIGGTLRIAVPDGCHPDPNYIEHVRPGGTGAGADDHQFLYTYKTITESWINMLPFGLSKDNAFFAQCTLALPSTKIRSYLPVGHSM